MFMWLVIQCMLNLSFDTDVFKPHENLSWISIINYFIISDCKPHNGSPCSPNCPLLYYHIVPCLCPFPWLGLRPTRDFYKMNQLIFLLARQGKAAGFLPNSGRRVTGGLDCRPGRGSFWAPQSVHFYPGQVLSVGEICSQLINGESVIPFPSLFMTLFVFLWIRPINHFQHFCHSSICPVSEAFCSKVSIACDLLWFPNNEWKVYFPETASAPRRGRAVLWELVCRIDIYCDFFLYCR